MKAISLIILFAAVSCFAGITIHKPENAEGVGKENNDPCSVKSTQTIKLSNDNVDYIIQGKNKQIDAMRKQIRELKEEVRCLKEDLERLRKKYGINENELSIGALATESVLGAYLGEDIESLRDRTHASRFRADTSKYENNKVVVWKYRTNSPEFPEAFAWTYKDKIFMIESFAKVDSDEDEINIVMSLLDKYSQSSLNRTKSRYTSISSDIGGINADISYREGKITYRHNSLENEIFEENKQKRVGRVKSDL